MISLQLLSDEAFQVLGELQSFSCPILWHRSAIGWHCGFVDIDKFVLMLIFLCFGVCPMASIAGILRVGNRLGRCLWPQLPTCLTSKLLCSYLSHRKFLFSLFLLCLSSMTDCDMPAHAQHLCCSGNPCAHLRLNVDACS